MGIRKYFEEMKGEKEAMKLSDLSMDVKEDRERLKFDVDEFFDRGDWQKELERLDILLKEDDLDNYFIELHNLILISRDKVADLLTDDLADKMQDLIEAGVLKSGIYNDAFVMSFSSRFKNIFPKQSSEFDFEQYWDEFVNVVREYEGKGNFFCEACNLKILFPTKFVQLEFDQEILQKARDSASSEKDAGIWMFAYYMSRMRIAFPEMYEEVGISSDDWQAMKERIALYKREGYGNMFLMAASMKILAAEEVRVGDNGLELIMKKEGDFKQVKKPRPERLEF